MRKMNIVSGASGTIAFIAMLLLLVMAVLKRQWALRVRSARGCRD